jgi:hypothetical protein
MHSRQRIRCSLAHLRVPPEVATSGFVEAEGWWGWIGCRRRACEGSAGLPLSRRIASGVLPRCYPGTRKVVGATGFEPATPCAQGRCATRLRYAPTLNLPDFTAFSNGTLIALP